MHKGIMKTLVHRSASVVTYGADVARRNPPLKEVHEMLYAMVDGRS